PRLTPSSRNCTPTTPTLSLASADIAMVPCRLEPADGAVNEQVGGVVSALFVVTVRVAVAVLPAASRATAVSVCEPLATVDEIHEMVYGATVSSVPMSLPSTRNCTPATPTSSLALAVTLAVPVTVAPDAGAVNATVGAVTSRGCAETTLEKLLWFPLVS